MEIRTHTVASGPGWHVDDIACSAGPHDRRFEEQHTSVCIAAVLRGSFQYRTTQGSATLAPGSLLLGNVEKCFECGHDHSHGDRCLSFHFDPAVIESVAAAAPGVRSTQFAAAYLPPLVDLAPVLVELEIADPGRMEEIALHLVGRTLSLLSDRAPPAATPTYRDEQRIAAALDRIGRDADQTLTLDGLATGVGMSRYHFLRTFRRIVGLTPHQFLLRTRLHAAAVALRRTPRPVLDIAMDAGFGDLSTFNRQFRAAMGASPRAYRTGRMALPVTAGQI
jgi:AraC family transcriptional regulator